MAKEKEAPAEEGEEGGGKKKLIIIIVGVVLLIGIAVGATLFLMGGDDAADGANAEDVIEEEPKGDPVYIEVKPAFTVNLDPNDTVGFLQISIQILTFYSEVGEEVETHMPLIKNNLFTLFASQKSENLRSAEGKAALQAEVLKTVQDVIDKYGSGGEVDNVFFTNFVMQ